MRANWIEYSPKDLYLIKYCPKDLRAGISYLIGGRRGVNILCLKRIFHMLHKPTHLVNFYLPEIEENESFKCTLSSALFDVGYVGYIGFPEGLYVLTRVLKPSVVVETGVACGVSSAHILMALEMNEGGELFSIDLPNYELKYFPKLGLKPVSILPRGRSPGFAIPSSLKHRWHLRLGSSKEWLSKLLDELKVIDVFLHDSEHTYENMMFEYAEAWKHLHKGGLLISDNVFINSALRDFSKLNARKPLYVYFSGWGCMVK